MDQSEKLRVDLRSALLLMVKYAEAYFNETHEKSLHEVLIDILQRGHIPYGLNEDTEVVVKVHGHWQARIVPFYPSRLATQTDVAVVDAVSEVVRDLRLVDVDHDRQRYVEFLLHAYGKYQQDAGFAQNAERQFEKVRQAYPDGTLIEATWLCEQAYMHEVTNLMGTLQRLMSETISLPPYFHFYMTVQQFVEAKRSDAIESFRNSFDDYVETLERQLKRVEAFWNVENDPKLYRHYRAFAAFQFSEKSKADVSQEFGFSNFTFHKDVIQPVSEKTGIVPRTVKSGRPPKDV